MNIAKAATEAIGQRVRMTIGRYGSKSQLPIFHGETVEGKITNFDKTQLEVEIDHSLMIGTQVIENIIFI